MTGRLTARDLALVATFAALIAVLGLPGSFSLSGNTVPVTAQTLGVMLAGSLLGARRGARRAAVPACSSPRACRCSPAAAAGSACFTSPSAGYFIGFAPGAFVVGAVRGSVGRAGSPSGGPCSRTSSAASS